MRAGQVAGANQELAGNLTAGEHERLFEQLDPLRLVARMVFVEPSRERAMTGADLLNTCGVGDCGVDLQAIADDAFIGEQALALAIAVGGDAINVEVVKGGAEMIALAQNRQP